MIVYPQATDWSPPGLTESDQVHSAREAWLHGAFDPNVIELDITRREQRFTERWRRTDGVLLARIPIFPGTWVTFPKEYWEP